jgi:WS/DGAT/MGAT family acyltransferase
MSVPLDRNRPLWELWIADRLDDGRVGVVGKAHHCMVDGIAAVELATLLLDPSPEPPPPEPEEWHPAGAPSGLRLFAEGTLDRVRRSASLALIPLELARHPGRGVELLSTGARALRAVRHSLAPAPPSVLNERISAGRHLASARRPFADLRLIKERYQATVNDVLLASAAGGVRRFLDHRRETPGRLKAMVPVSVRETDRAGELGNRISFVFVELPCDEPAPVGRLAKVKAAMQARKQSGEPEGAQAVLHAMEYAPLTLQHAVSHAAASERAFNLVVSNIPGPQQPFYMNGSRLLEAYPAVPLNPASQGLTVGVLSYDGGVHFGLLADRDLDPGVEAAREALAEALAELTVA